MERPGRQPESGQQLIGTVDEKVEVLEEAEEAEVGGDRHDKTHMTPPRLRQVRERIVDQVREADRHDRPGQHHPAHPVGAEEARQFSAVDPERPEKGGCRDQ